MAAITGNADQEPSGQVSRHEDWKPIWAGTWLAASAVTLAIFLSSRHLAQPSEVKGAVGLVAQLAATVALFKGLGRPRTETLVAAPETRRWPLAMVTALSVLILFPIGAFGPILLVPVGGAAAVVLLVLQPRLSPRETWLAALLGVVSAAGGLVEWSLAGGAVALASAVAQLPLVFLTLLAGWAIAQRVGWVEAAIGPTIYPSKGAWPAFRGFGFGALLALPWAFGNIASGPFEEDRIPAAWQVLSAFRPAIAEEAWGRVFLVALLYWIFRRYARARTALLVAFLFSTYWFAFIHVPFNPVAAFLLATIQVLPLTYLWLRRGLEAAIGFHLCADLVRFFAAYLAFQGVWFS